VYSTANSHGGTETVRLRPVKARYVKVNGIERATEFGYSIYEMEVYGEDRSDTELTPLHFISLELKEADGKIISDNFYWRNGVNDLDYRALNSLPEADIACELVRKEEVDGKGRIEVKITNNSRTVAFGNRLRLVNQTTKERVLPVIMNDNYVTLTPGEQRVITIEADREMFEGHVDLLVKQYNQAEKGKLSVKF